MLYIKLMCLLILLSSCSIGYRVIPNYYLNKDVITQMNFLYDPWMEKGFCVSSYEVHNILDGGWMSYPLPICNFTEIVFHTHPIWAENGANILDGLIWDEYNRRFGNKKYGVMLGIDEFKVYIKE